MNHSIDSYMHPFVSGSQRAWITNWLSEISLHDVNTLRPGQNGRHCADDTFKRISLNENVIVSINILLKFADKAPINNIPALV